MKRAMKRLLFGAVAALGLLFAVPPASDAANVTPVRSPYHYAPHRGYYGPHHGYYRSWDRYPGRYYYYRPGVRVYRYPHRYHDYYRHHPHGGVDIGPFRFELWH